MCGFSCSHHLPVEGLSLTDFPNQNKTIHKALRGTHQGEGDLSILYFPLPTSEGSNALIHQISQTEATNLFCFVQHMAAVTSSNYTLSQISLVTSSSLNKFTERAEANNPRRQVIVYLCIYLVTYQSIPRAFPEELHKK